jgi:nitrate reductase gamma subunit
MESWIQFGRGPVFAAAFAVMILGLARIFLLTIIGLAEAYARSWDRLINWKEVAQQTVNWLLPVRRLWRARPVYSTFSLLFHVGLLLVPLFLAAHVLLWRGAIGFAWKSLPQRPADVLTILTLVTGLGLLLGRAISSASSRISRPQEYFWLVLLLAPFSTGFLCTHAALSAKAYRDLMLLHVYSADLIMALIPFTKIAHCVLAPLSQSVTAVAWKFPPGAGDRVAATLGYADVPVWALKARLNKPVHSSGSSGEGKREKAASKVKQEVTAS